MDKEDGLESEGVGVGRMNLVCDGMRSVRRLAVLELLLSQGT